MELDKRIKEGKRPLTCFDTEQAKEFLGKECYFTNAYCTFEDLHRIPKSELQYISNDKDASDPYKTACYFYPFCLPCEWVEEEKKEPKYRPYTLAEWADQHEIGEVIHFMNKDYKQEFNVMYTGYVIEHGEDIEDIRTIGRIMLMGTAYFLEDLFENYVICINGIWQPFGVIEDD